MATYLYCEKCGSPYFKVSNCGGRTKELKCKCPTPEEEEALRLAWEAQATPEEIKQEHINLIYRHGSPS